VPVPPFVPPSWNRPWQLAVGSLAAVYAGLSAVAVLLAATKTDRAGGPAALRAMWSAGAIVLGLLTPTVAVCMYALFVGWMLQAGAALRAAGRAGAHHRLLGVQYWWTSMLVVFAAGLFTADQRVSHVATGITMLRDGLLGDGIRIVIGVLGAYFAVRIRHDVDELFTPDGEG
jgi:hypothetical protein